MALPPRSPSTDPSYMSRWLKRIGYARRRHRRPRSRRRRRRLRAERVSLPADILRARRAGRRVDRQRGDRARRAHRDGDRRLRRIATAMASRATPIIDAPPMGRLVALNLTKGEGGVGSELTPEIIERAVRHGVGPKRPRAPHHAVRGVSVSDATTICARSCRTCCISRR